jgi:hypothetical protein
MGPSTILINKTLSQVTVRMEYRRQNRNPAQP